MIRNRVASFEWAYLDCNVPSKCVMGYGATPLCLPPCTISCGVVIRAISRACPWSCRIVAATCAWGEGRCAEGGRRQERNERANEHRAKLPQSWSERLQTVRRVSGGGSQATSTQKWKSHSKLAAAPDHPSKLVLPEASPSLPSLQPMQRNCGNLARPQLASVRSGHSP